MNQPRVQALLQQRSFTWERDEWFAPLSVALGGLNAAQAAWQPPGAAGNTIWQTLNHLNYYNERVLCRLTGATQSRVLPDNDATFGEPGDPADEAGWQATVAETERLHSALNEALAAMTEADLDQPSEALTLGERLAAWALHDAHHSGQILLIRKQQGSWPARRA